MLAEAGAIVIDHVDRRVEAWPIDILDAIPADEAEGSRGEQGPEDEVPLEREACARVDMFKFKVGSTTRKNAPDVRGSVSPQRIMKIENRRMCGIYTRKRFSQIPASFCGAKKAHRTNEQRSPVDN